MSSRLVSSSLPIRLTARTAAIASTRCLEAPRVEHVNHNAINFATLNKSMKQSPTQAFSSPTLLVAKSLSNHIKSSTLPSASSPWPVDVFAKAFDEESKPEKFSKTFVHGEKQGQVARVREPVEKELWLERFGGPGKTLEKVAGKGMVVLRDFGEDGMAYLRVLI
jgi:hypothetical protein